MFLYFVYIVINLETVSSSMTRTLLFVSTCQIIITYDAFVYTKHTRLEVSLYTWLKILTQMELI